MIADNSTSNQSDPLTDNAQTTGYQLLHLSSLSLLPTDIVSIHWNVLQGPAKNLVTRIRTRSDLFILKSDCPYYESDLATLREAVGEPQFK